MNDISIIIIVALVGIGIGFALGGLFIGMRGEHGQSKQPAQASNLRQVAILWTERGKNKVQLQVDDKLFRNLTELSDEQRVQLKPYIESLSAWFGQPVKAPDGVPAPQYDQSVTKVPEAFISTADEVNPLAEAKRPSMNPVNVFARAIQSDVAVPEGPPKSIALQVDEILQEKLIGTPLEKRGIRLMELPNKGMVVLVGLDQYDSVDSVTDQEVRSVIKSAVAEWEKRVSDK